MSTVQGRILIAEDEPEMAQLLGCLLHREGLTPLLAKDGIEAAGNWSAREDPTCCWRTCEMRNMDGMEVDAAKAKDLDPEALCVLTGYARCGERWSLRAGAHDYLAKPFDNRQVIRVVLRRAQRAPIEAPVKTPADHVHQALSRAETFGPSGPSAA